MYNKSHTDDIDDRDTKVLEFNHRHTETATQIIVRNQCTEMIEVVAYYHNGFQWSVIGWIAVGPGERTELTQTSFNKFYIYAQSNNNEWGGNSEICFNGEPNTCLEEVSFDQGRSAYTHDFSCGESNSPPPETGGTNNNQGQQSERDSEWLNAHNEKRDIYHSRYNVNYVPLKWSQDLAESALVYANKLVARNECTISHKYQGDSYGGENLAANWGSGGRRPPANILFRWVDSEESYGYPQNGHLTQVVWRATKYVGCGEASKSMPSGGQCHIQVCRYLRPGNCNANGENWEQKMVEATSPCTPSCPQEGCF